MALNCYCGGEGHSAGRPALGAAAVRSWLLGAVALAGADERRVPAQVSVGVGGGSAAPPELVLRLTLCFTEQTLTALLLSFLAKSYLVCLLMASCGIHC